MGVPSFQIYPSDEAHGRFHNARRYWHGAGPWEYGGAWYFLGFSLADGVYDCVRTDDYGASWSVIDQQTPTTYDDDLFDGRSQPYSVGSAGTIDFVRIGNVIYITWLHSEANDGVHLPVRVATLDLAGHDWVPYVGGLPPSGNGPLVAVFVDRANPFQDYNRGQRATCSANGKLFMAYNGEYANVYERLHGALWNPGTLTWSTPFAITTKVGKSVWPHSAVYDPVADRVHVLLYTTYGIPVDNPIYHAVVNPNTGAVDSEVLVTSTPNSTMFSYGAGLFLGVEDGARKLAFCSFSATTESIPDTFGTRPLLKLHTYDIVGGAWSTETIPFPPAEANDHNWTILASGTGYTQTSAAPFFDLDKVHILCCTCYDLPPIEDPQFASIWRVVRNGAGWSYCRQRQEPAESTKKWYGPQPVRTEAAGPGFVAWADYSIENGDGGFHQARWFPFLECGRRGYVDEA